MLEYESIEDIAFLYLKININLSKSKIIKKIISRKITLTQQFAQLAFYFRFQCVLNEYFFPRKKIIYVIIKINDFEKKNAFNY